MAGGSIGPTSINIPRHTSDPSGGEGDMYFNTADNAVRVHDGDEWVAVYEEPPFSLSSYSPTAWWDASTASGTSTVSASAGSYSMSSSGTVSASSFPNGTSALRVSGGHYSSSYLVPSGSSSKTLMAVIYNFASGTGYKHVLHTGTNTSGKAFGLAHQSNGYFDQHIWGGSGAQVTSSNATNILGQTGNNGIAIFFSRYNGSVGTIRAYTNYSSWVGFASNATFGLNTGGTYGLLIGSRIAAGETGTFTWGEVAAWSSSLTDTQMDEIAAGMKTKWVD